MECPKCGDWNLYQDIDGNYRCTNCGYFEPYSMERRKKIYEQLGLEDPLSDWYEEDNK
mgnify:FL=1